MSCTALTCFWYEYQTLLAFSSWIVTYFCIRLVFNMGIEFRLKLLSKGLERGLHVDTAVGGTNTKKTATVVVTDKKAISLFAAVRRLLLRIAFGDR